MASEIKNAQARTDAKLRYSKLHIQELVQYEHKGSGHDFERAHVESFLFHLFGARDAFLQELNVYYGCGFDLNKVSINNLKKFFKNNGIVCPEFEELIKIGGDSGSWLKDLKEMRHFSIHCRNIPFKMEVGGIEDGEVSLKNPSTGEFFEEDYILTFKKWQSEMEKLLNGLRVSAGKNQENNGI